MSKRHAPLLILLVPVILVTLLSGCMTTGFGTISYTPGALHLNVSGAENRTDAVLQVTIFALQDLQQQEIYKHADYVSVMKGENSYTESVTLPPGSYRVYLYLTYGNERKAAVIRDLKV